MSICSMTWLRRPMASSTVLKPIGLLDGLEADAVVGEAGDGQGARDGAGGEDEFVVGDGLARALLAGGEGGHGRGAGGVVDRGDLAEDDPASREDGAQRDDDVPR
jgi:hypothetical protein